MKAGKKNLLIFFGLFVAFFFYFSQGLDSVPYHYWDEEHYILAANSYLEGNKPYFNSEHPPLGKELMALGMSVFGNEPWGWRVASVFCGALSCTLIAYLVFLWTGSLGIGLFTACLLPLDPMLLVHFRMALLEAPLMAGLLLATLAAYQFLQGTRPRLPVLYLWGLAAGVALAIKLNTLVFLPIWWVLAGLYLRKNQAKLTLWLQSLVALTALPLAVLFLSYGIIGYNPMETLELLAFMWNFHQFYQGPAKLFSRWYEWIWIKEPIWYVLRRPEPTVVHAVVLTGNLVLWIGSLAALIYLGIRKYRDQIFWLFALPIFFQIILYARKPTTFFYYMVQVLPFLYLLLGGALGDLWQRWGRRFGTLLRVDFALLWLGALIVFVNYWPLLWGQPFNQALYERKTGQTLPTWRASPRSGVNAPAAKPSQSTQTETQKHQGH